MKQFNPFELGAIELETRVSNFDRLLPALLKREGGYVADDAGAGETNFGINARANPDIDVKNLTPQRAAQIYKERYWQAIDADNLDPRLQPMVLDTAVNQGVAKAKELLAKSENNPLKYKELRQQH